MTKILPGTPSLQPFHTLRALFSNLPPLNPQALADALRAAGHEAVIADVRRLAGSGELFRAIRSFHPEGEPG